MTYTMTKLVSDKTVRRGDLFRVAIENLVVVEGFNDSRRFNDPAELRSHIDGMKAFVRNGGKLPPIEVWVNPETGATELVEGHCRTNCYRELALEGFEVKPGEPLEYVNALLFTGTAAERKARIVTSNSQLALAPLGYAKVYSDLRAEGLSNSEIAAMVGKSRGHVDQMLLLADGGEQVHEAVKAGVVSATEAVKIVREHKEDAGAEIERRAEVAAEQGKAKVTAAIGKPKQPKPAKVKREWPTNLVAAARAVFTSLGDDALKIIMGDCKPMEEVDSGILAELLMAISDIPRDDEPSAVVDDGQMDMLEAQA